MPQCFQWLGSVTAAVVLRAMGFARGGKPLSLGAVLSFFSAVAY